jgi:CHAD domain-containing protein
MAGNSSRSPGAAPDTRNDCCGPPSGFINEAVEGTMSGGESAPETLTQMARRALLAHLDMTIQGLDAQRSSDAAVHDIRKELKRARAALRMLRECLGAAEFRRDNALIRDAAHPLTPIRDAKVLLQTLGQLASRKGTDSGFFRSLRKTLEDGRRLARRRLQSDEVSAAARVLRGIRSRAAALPDGRLAAAHPPALERAFRKARSAYGAAKREGTDESLHEWRKQTKYFANQLEILLPLGSRLFDKSHRRATQLADCLGDDHDLAILTEQIHRHTVEAHPPASGPDARRLMRTVKRRRKKLKRQAMHLGQRLYSGRAARYRS